MKKRVNICRSCSAAATIACALGFFIACQNKTHTESSCGFFYWKTVFHLSDYERQYLDSSACKVLYVKFADIGYQPQSGHIEPYTLLRVADTSGIGQRTVVPCFFITNEVFRQTHTPEWLSKRLVESWESVGAGFGPRPNRTQVLIDCDWTAGTRQAFFAFLVQLKKQLPAATQLTVTIRLHQYQAPKTTGVPPADRGMLMLYNTGDIDRADTPNSIFDSTDAQRYTANAPANYPLPLDVALPVFSWYLVYREHELWKILPQSVATELQDTSRFVLRGRFFEARRPTFLASQYLRTGDQIRLEEITPATLRAAAHLANTLSIDEQSCIAYYHADSMFMSKFLPQDLRTLATRRAD